MHVCVCVLIKICSRSQLEFVIWQHSRLISTDIVNKPKREREGGREREQHTYKYIFYIEREVCFN